MKTKLKDFLLYSMACIGAISLFLSAYQPQQSISSVPESHVWELVNVDGRPYSINKQTGETRTYSRQTTGTQVGHFTKGLEYWSAEKLEYGQHKKK
ncbi:MAG: hypothetical protein ACJ0O0_01285 [Flavobacteriaceae bacterium]